MRFELSKQIRGEHIRRQIAGADVDPSVLVDLTTEEPAAIRALFAYDLGSFHERGIVHQQGSAFPADHVLRLMKALGRHASERAEVPVLVAAEEPVRVVLNDWDSVLFGKRANLIHLTA